MVARCTHGGKAFGVAILRWLLSDRVRPFSASFAKYLFGRRTLWTDGRDSKRCPREFSRR